MPIFAKHWKNLPGLCGLICSKFTAQLRDLTYIVCMRYRDEVVINHYVKHYYCTQSPCNLLCDLLRNCLLLNLFMLVITKGLNIWNFWICLFDFEHNSTLTWWGIVCRPVSPKSKWYPFKMQAVTQQNVKKVKWCEYFLKALYTHTLVSHNSPNPCCLQRKAPPDRYTPNKCLKHP